MKFYINREKIEGPWGGGNLWVSAAYDKFDTITMHDLLTGNDVDAIILAGIYGDQSSLSAGEAILYKRYRPKTKLFLRVNENDARKNTTGVDETLIDLSKNVDGTIFVSDWLKSYFSEKWHCTNNIVIHNGVDANIFKPSAKLNNGKINIVAHHWSDNVLKGFDIYDEIDAFVGENQATHTFTYIGRHRGTFKNTRCINPLHGKALGDELGKYDVYVSASRFDPGPNHVIEPISCKLPTYVHVDGGGCVEFAGIDHVYNDWSELRKLLLSGKFILNSTNFCSWSHCIDQYDEFIRR